MIRTAVIGFGLSAQTFHMPFLNSSSEYEVVAISSRQTELIQTKYPGIKIYPQAEDLLNNTKDIELVIITAPNAVHYRLAKQALKQNLHVVLEKPFVNDLNEGKELIEIAQQTQKILSVYHNRRWDSDFLTLQALISSEVLGRIHYFESHFDRFRPQVQKRWREEPGPGAGIWYDLGPHLLDQALILFGSPHKLTARCLKLRPQAQVTDYFHVQLHYPGLEVVLHASPFAAGRKQRFLLQGNQGAYVKYGMDPQEERLKQGLLPNHPNWAQEDEENQGYLSDHKNSKIYPGISSGYQVYYSKLARAIKGQGENPVTAQEALKVIYLLERAIQSSESGQTCTV